MLPTRTKISQTIPPSPRARTHEWDAGAHAARLRGLLLATTLLAGCASATAHGRTDAPPAAPPPTPPPTVVHLDAATAPARPEPSREEGTDPASSGEAAPDGDGEAPDAATDVARDGEPMASLVDHPEQLHGGLLNLQVGLNAGGTGLGSVGTGSTTTVGIDPIAPPAGGLTKEEVRRTAMRSLPYARRCYAKALTRAPSLAGRIVVLVVVGASGEVLDAQLQTSTLGDAEVEECVVVTIRSSGFPPPNGGRAAFKVPYTFASRPAAPTR
jgi:TonB family protein